MDIGIPYGQSVLPLRVAASRLLGVYAPEELSEGAEAGTLRRALEKPVAGEPFSDFMGGTGKVLIVVNDGTRTTPTPRILGLIQPQLARSEPDFLVATGNHRAPTQAERRRIFGDFAADYAHCIHAHDAGNDRDMIPLGRTKAGTEIIINRAVVEADRLLVIGSVEPHYFAGFTGGRKSLIPGVAARETITQNHRNALNVDAQALQLGGNPVHEDLIDALRAINLGRIFSIQTVQDRERRIIAASTGGIENSFDALIPAAKQAYSVTIPEKADVVISVAEHPMDLDLYQAQKAIESGKHALKRNGVLILVSQCPMGLGERTFFDLLSTSKEPQAVKERIEAGYVLGYHKAAKIVELATWGEVWALTDLPPDQVRAAHMRPIDDLQGAVEAALAERGDGATLLILREASNLMPLVEGKRDIDAGE